MNPSFGFSVHGTKEATLAQLADVSVEGRPEHSIDVVDGVRAIVEALPDNTTVSITVNTHLEEVARANEKPGPAPALTNKTRKKR